eukprot:TRINITY_DN217_c1_g1_i1.p1 TRINITY_DN217_c1_g1~~TRINITY_DN217_c1_g1_i1.p1  ORF type:complete len:273 (-),score=69.53 TRINITY_DN217_c1_g1_i1:65-808(-)
MGGAESTSIIKEMETAQMETDPTTKDKILKTIYDRADKNKSGFLEQDEAKKFFGQLYDYLTNKRYIDVGGGVDRKTVLKTWMDHYDRDKNGKIDYSEFVRVLDLMWGLKGNTGKDDEKKETKEEKRTASPVTKTRKTETHEKVECDKEEDSDEKEKEKEKEVTKTTAIPITLSTPSNTNININATNITEPMTKPPGVSGNERGLESLELDKEKLKSERAKLIAKSAEVPLYFLVIAFIIGMLVGNYF